MRYNLLNKSNDRKLAHPAYGIWSTPELKEAQSMLKACKDHLTASGLENLQNNFVIVEEESGQEVPS
jgi:hypothetical protein